MHAVYCSLHNWLELRAVAGECSGPPDLASQRLVPTISGAVGRIMVEMERCDGQQWTSRELVRGRRA